MKNYTIELYGWTLDAKAKSINLAQVDQINNLKNDAGAKRRKIELFWEGFGFNN
jgi:hypothetical protein